MLNNSLNYIKQCLNGFSPDTALILGSGLDGVSQAVENPIYINYADISDFPNSKEQSEYSEKWYASI